MRGSRKFRQVRWGGVGGGVGLENYFSHQRISQRHVRTSLEKQLDPRRGSRTRISKDTYSNLWFSRGGGGPPAPPPSGSTNGEPANLKNHPAYRISVFTWQPDGSAFLIKNLRFFWWCFKGIYLSKALTCMKTFLKPLLDTVNNAVTCWMNFRENHLHEHDLQLFDYNI